MFKRTKKKTITASYTGTHKFTSYQHVCTAMLARPVFLYERNYIIICKMMRSLQTLHYNQHIMSVIYCQVSCNKNIVFLSHFFSMADCFPNTEPSHPYSINPNQKTTTPNQFHYHLPIPFLPNLFNSPSTYFERQQQFNIGLIVVDLTA